MKIFVVCSRHFYHKIPPIKEELEKQGHNVTLPNSYDAPFKEEEVKNKGEKEHQEWKSAMMKRQEPKVRANDAVLVLNFEKNGQENYVGGATFMEIVKAWELEKKIFFWNPIPKSIFEDELKAINPRVIFGDVAKIE